MAWSKLSRHQRGYGTAWDKLRLTILHRDNHLCQPCKRNGRLRAGTHVDHIKAKAKGGTDDAENLECICAPCHRAKTTADAGGRVRQTIGTDGWPVQE